MAFKNALGNFFDHSLTIKQKLGEYPDYFSLCSPCKVDYTTIVTYNRLQK